PRPVRVAVPANARVLPESVGALPSRAVLRVIQAVPRPRRHPEAGTASLPAQRLGRPDDWLPRKPARATDAPGIRGPGPVARSSVVAVPDVSLCLVAVALVGGRVAAVPVGGVFVVGVSAVGVRVVGLPVAVRRQVGVLRLVRLTDAAAPGTDRGVSIRS